MRRSPPRRLPLSPSPWPRASPHAHLAPAPRSYEDLILQALLYTAFIFICLTVWTIQSKVQFDFLAAPLTVALLLVIFAGIVARVFHSPILYTVYAYCGALVFMG